MARPTRNNVDYFPFYCEEGEKMFYLEQTYGNDGFAVFVKLLRELARKDYHYINLSDQSSKMFLAAKCRVSIELLEAIIKDLVMLGKFHKELWEENSIIWCESFVNSIQDAYKKRNSDCITLQGLYTLLHSLGIRKLNKSSSKGVDNPQSKVKESKEEYNTLTKSERFEKFWDFYGKKQDKKKCKSIFLKLTESEIGKIREHLPKYLNSVKDKQYIKKPLNYLNGECWNDEIINQEETSKKAVEFWNAGEVPDDVLRMIDPKDPVQNRTNMENIMDGWFMEGLVHNMEKCFEKFMNDYPEQYELYARTYEEIGQGSIFTKDEIRRGLKHSTQLENQRQGIKGV